MVDPGWDHYEDEGALLESISILQSKLEENRSRGEDLVKSLSTVQNCLRNLEEDMLPLRDKIRKGMAEKKNLSESIKHMIDIQDKFNTVSLFESVIARGPRSNLDEFLSAMESVWEAHRFLGKHEFADSAERLARLDRMQEDIATQCISEFERLLSRCGHSVRQLHGPVYETTDPIAEEFANNALAIAEAFFQFGKDNFASILQVFEDRRSSALTQQLLVYEQRHYDLRAVSRLGAEEGSGSGPDAADGDDAEEKRHPWLHCLAFVRELLSAEADLVERLLPVRSNRALAYAMTIEPLVRRLCFLGDVAMLGHVGRRAYAPPGAARKGGGVPDAEMARVRDELEELLEAVRRDHLAGRLEVPIADPGTDRICALLEMLDGFAGEIHRLAALTQLQSLGGAQKVRPTAELERTMERLCDAGAAALSAHADSIRSDAASGELANCGVHPLASHVLRSVRRLLAVEGAYAELATRRKLPWDLSEDAEEAHEAGGVPRQQSASPRARGSPGSRLSARVEGRDAVTANPFASDLCAAEEEPSAEGAGGSGIDMYFGYALRALVENLHAKGQEYTRRSGFQQSDALQKSLREAKQHLFLLNNLNYLLKGLGDGGAGAGRIAGRVDGAMLQSLERMRNDEHHRVSRALFSQLTVHLRPVTETLEKQRGSDLLTLESGRVLKARFDGFNEAFDAIVRDFSQATIPDAHLRDMILRDAREQVARPHEAFFRQYSQVHFSKKKQDRYLRLTPDIVGASIDALFRG